MIFKVSRTNVCVFGTCLFAVTAMIAAIAPASVYAQQQPAADDHPQGGLQQTLTDQPVSRIAEMVNKARKMEAEHQFQMAAEVWQEIAGELEKTFGRDSWQVNNALLAKNIASTQGGFSEQQMQIKQQIRDLQSEAVKQTDVEKLLQIIQQAENLTAQLFGPESHMVAQIKTQSAAILQNINRPEEAWQQFRDALPIARKSFGPQHPDTELIYFKLGVLLHSAGQSDRAVDHLTQAVGICKNVYGEASPLYADRLTTLGVACQALAKYDRALEYLMQGEKIQKQVLGEQHPRRAQTLRDIGVTYLSMQEATLSQKYLSESIQILQQKMQLNDPFLLATMSQLATALAMDGRNSDAEKLLVKILEGNREAFGADSVQTAKTEFQLGVMYGKRAAFKEADPLMQHAMQIQLSVLGAENRSTQRTATAYMAILDRLGKTEQIAQVRQAMQGTSTAQNPESVPR